MTRLHRSFAVPLLAAGLVLLGACSSSTSSGEKASSKGAAATTVAKGADKTTTTDDASGPGTTSGSKSSNGPIHLSGSFCDMLRQLDSQESDIFMPEEGADPATNLEKLKAGFANLVDVLEQLQAKAPAEIKADIDFTVEEFEKINAQVQKMTKYGPDELSGITGDEFDTPEAQKHSDNVDAYTKDKCGFDPNADETGNDTAS